MLQCTSAVTVDVDVFAVAVGVDATFGENSERDVVVPEVGEGEPVG